MGLGVAVSVSVPVDEYSRARAYTHTLIHKKKQYGPHEATPACIHAAMGFVMRPSLYRATAFVAEANRSLSNTYRPSSPTTILLNFFPSLFFGGLGHLVCSPHGLCKTCMAGLRQCRSGLVCRRDDVFNDICCPSSYNSQCPQAQASATCVGFEKTKDEHGCVISCKCIAPAPTAGSSRAADSTTLPKTTTTAKRTTYTWGTTLPPADKSGNKGSSTSTDAIIWAVVIAMLIIVGVMFIALRKRRATQRGQYNMALTADAESMRMLELRRAQARSAYTIPPNANSPAASNIHNEPSRETDMDNMNSVSRALNLPVQPTPASEGNDEYLEVAGMLQGESSTDYPEPAQLVVLPVASSTWVPEYYNNPDDDVQV